MTRTGLAPRLLKHSSAPTIGLNPDDAEDRGLHSGDLMELRNKLGHVRGLLETTQDLPPG